MKKSAEKTQFSADKFYLEIASPATVPDEVPPCDETAGVSGVTTEGPSPLTSEGGSAVGSDDSVS